MKTYLLGLLCAVFSVVSHSSTIVMGVQDQWPPYFNSPSQPIGYAQKLLENIFCVAGYSLKTELHPWNRAYKMVEQLEKDVLLGTWKTPEREKAFLLSKPYYINQIKLISRIDSSIGLESLNNPNDITLNGMTLGVVTGYAYADNLVSDNIFLWPTQNPEESIIHLSKHRVDAIIMDEVVFYWHLNNMNLDSEQFYTSKEPIQTLPLHIAISRFHPSAELIIAHFNSVLSLHQVLDIPFAPHLSQSCHIEAPLPNGHR